MHLGSFVLSLPSASPGHNGHQGHFSAQNLPAPAQHPPNSVTPAAGSLWLITVLLLQANSLSASNSLRPSSAPRLPAVS